MTVADLQQFTPKSKPVTYTEAFIELYNWRNGRQVHKIYKIIEFKKMYALIVENPCNLATHQIIGILLVLHNTHVIPRDQDKFVFYVNNYIDWDQFNQLYDPNWMKKGVQNADAVARKPGPALTRVNNYKLEVVREKRRKREEMVERWKIEAIAAKYCKNRGGISMSNEEKGNYESDTRNDTDPDQADDKYPL